MLSHGTGRRMLALVTVLVLSLPSVASAAAMAVNLDGVDDHLYVTGTSALKPSAQLAIEAWVKLTATDVSGAEIASMGDRYLLRIDSSGLLFFYFYNGTSTAQTITASGGNLKDGVWHHVVGQKTASALQLYVDNIARGNVSNSSTIAYPGIQNLYIGKHGNGGTSYDFNGALDEVRIYNRALTANEIAAHYSAGAGQFGTAESGLVGGWHLDEGTGTTAADYSGNGNTATLKNGPTWVAGKVGSSAAADTAPPIISITAPAAGGTVSGASVTASANASDNVGVAGVQFKLDGANLGAEDTASPYSVSWNTTTATNAAHTLSAVARDAAGNTATAASVSVTVDNASPQVTAGPAASAISGTGATITWTTNEAADSRVDYGTTTSYGLNKTDATRVTSHSLALTGLTAGTLYHYKVTSADAAGNTVVSADATFTTAAPTDVTPPTVSITSPAAATAVGGSTVPLSANASDNVGVVGVQFKLDGANLGAEDTATPYALTWNSTQVPDGAHTVTATARDAAGNQTTSGTVSITVDNTPPTISFTSPADGQVIVAPAP